MKKKKFYPNGNPRSIRCDIFDWHKIDNEVGFDGCSFTCTCVRCGRSLLQDSQGNWFASDYPKIEAK